jgi:hypothetical protein
VRIFPHNDNAGREAGVRWAVRLVAARANVDGFSFAGLSRFDGAPVKDLNDFSCIHPDDWEAQRDVIEEAFAFAPEAAKKGSNRLCAEEAA